MLDTIVVTSLLNSTICIIWRRALSICTTFFSSFAPWRNPSILLLYKSIHFLKGKRAGQSSLVGFTRGEGLCDLTAHYCWKAGPCDLTARINVPTT